LLIANACRPALARAISGPLAGKALTPVVSGVHFWFAWAAFKPGARVAG
jgi:hypothetical protein